MPIGVIVLKKGAEDIFVREWENFDVLSGLMDVYVASNSDGEEDWNVRVVLCNRNLMYIFRNIKRYGSFKNSVLLCIDGFVKEKGLVDVVFNYAGLGYGKDGKDNVLYLIFKADDGGVLKREFVKDKIKGLWGLFVVEG